MPVLDLVDCIKPGSVIYDNVAPGTDEEVRKTSLILLRAGKGRGSNTCTLLHVYSVCI